jgi:hypothetical protein
MTVLIKLRIQHTRCLAAFIKLEPCSQEKLKYESQNPKKGKQYPFTSSLRHRESDPGDDEKRNRRTNRPKNGEIVDRDESMTPISNHSNHSVGTRLPDDACERNEYSDEPLSGSHVADGLCFIGSGITSDTTEDTFRMSNEYYANQCNQPAASSFLVKIWPKNTEQAQAVTMGVRNLNTVASASGR